MHIYFSGIGGAGLSPLALLAKQAGFEVSGSDKQDSQSLQFLKEHGVTDVHVGQTEETISEIHASKPIDWLVYSAAVVKENPSGHPEIEFAKNHQIRTTKENEFVKYVVDSNQLKLIAVAGTHGKSTTASMIVWLFKELGLPVSYVVGAKLSFAEPACFDTKGQYFIFECDEFDRKFLVFHPYMSIVTGIAWDHHEIFKSPQEYNEAFTQFARQSEHNVVWQDNTSTLRLVTDDKVIVLSKSDEAIRAIKLAGEVNRQNAWQAVTTVAQATGEPVEKLLTIIDRFPGLSRRMEEIRANLFSDYAHTPEKIAGAMNTALEIAKARDCKLTVIYEPLTNRRALHIKDQLKGVFAGVNKLYWVPSYLAREDPDQAVLSPSELISHLEPSVQAVAKPAELNAGLKAEITSVLGDNNMVVAISGGGGGSLDEWIRKEFSS